MGELADAYVACQAAFVAACRRGAPDADRLETVRDAFAVLAAEELIARVSELEAAWREFADEGCSYGDNCPSFGTRHGRCISCKARLALKGGG